MAEQNPATKLKQAREARTKAKHVPIPSPLEGKGEGDAQACAGIAEGRRRIPAYAEPASSAR